jgi:simple sugar transport system substrate-binding protein/ribose transport system substrate-binding protein
MKKSSRLKKLLGLVISTTMVLGLIGCSSTDDTSEEQSTGVLANKTVGFSQTDSMSSWRTTETDSIKEAVEAAGGEFIVKDAGGDIATQETDIRDLIAAGVDYLVVAPLEDNGLQGALKEAMDNEIPVILVDRAIDGQAGVHYTTAIMSDFVWEGEQCAKALTEALPDGANIVVINGGYDSSTSTDRQDGFVNALDSSKYKVVAEQNGEWLMDKAQAVMENIIQAQGGENIDAVFAVTDDMIQGAKTAIEAANLVVGEDILTLGIDGTRAAFEDIESGKQLASVTCSPYFGPIVVDTITKIANGEEVAQHITNEDTLYTKENVNVDLGF